MTGVVVSKVGRQAGRKSKFLLINKTEHYSNSCEGYKNQYLITIADVLSL